METTFDSQALLRGGSSELPELDPNYETFTKWFEQSIDVAGLLLPVAIKPGSSLTIHRINDSRQVTGSTVANTGAGDFIEEIQAPINAGETLEFDWRLWVVGSSSDIMAVVVSTPPLPSGGFQLIGYDHGQTLFTGDAFGSDDFNNPAGSIRPGIAEDPTGFRSVRILGNLTNGPHAGLIRLQLAQGPGVGSLTYLVIMASFLPSEYPTLDGYVNRTSFFFTISTLQYEFYIVKTGSAYVLQLAQGGVDVDTSGNGPGVITPVTAGLRMIKGLIYTDGADPPLPIWSLAGPNVLFVSTLVADDTTFPASEDAGFALAGTNTGTDPFNGRAVGRGTGGIAPLSSTMESLIVSFFA